MLPNRKMVTTVITNTRASFLIIFVTSFLCSYNVPVATISKLSADHQIFFSNCPFFRQATLTHAMNNISCISANHQIITRRAVEIAANIAPL
jgi:hypothetical protein